MVDDDAEARTLYVEEFERRIERDGLERGLASAVETILYYRRMSSAGMTRAGRQYLVIDALTPEPEADDVVLPKPELT